MDIAVNHDPEAIALHTINHPQTEHYVSDVFEINPHVATRGRPVGLLWASPDCKHFSKAKGGKPVSKKIRSLAWVVVKWAKAVRPRVICLENVEEFQTWGPLGADNIAFRDIVELDPKTGDTKVLQKVQKLTVGLQQVDSVDTYQIISIASKKIKEVRASTEGVESRPIMWPELPKGPAEMAVLKEAVLNNPLISGLKADKDVQALSRIWLRELTPHKYAYNFKWMGRPIIQVPQDMMAMQEILWEVKPDLVILELGANDMLRALPPARSTSACSSGPLTLGSVSLTETRPPNRMLRRSGEAR